MFIINLLFYLFYLIIYILLILLIIHRNQLTFPKLVQLPISILATLAIRNLSNQPSSSTSTIIEATSSKRVHSHHAHEMDTLNNNKQINGNSKTREGDDSAKQRHRMEGMVKDCEEVQEPLCGELCTAMMGYLLEEYQGSIPSQARKLLCDGLIALVTIEDSERGKWISNRLMII